MLEYLRSLLDEKASCNSVFKRNIVKEYLQILALGYLYTHDDYRHLVFYGGSCLRHCYDLPRLSEDLDFVDTNKNINIETLSKDLSHFFKSKLDVDVTTKIQKFRCVLKFPILHELKLTAPSESDFLFLKVEIYTAFDFCKEYRAEIKPLFRFGESILVRVFDLPTLMATKIRAIIHRKWEKTSKDGKVLAVVKGRDYFDLMWYLQQNITPNLACIEGVSDEKELYSALMKHVENVDAQSIKYDLEGLIEDPQYVNVLKDSIKEILRTSIEKKVQ